jgi:16S rRNA processing protein RimM
MAEDRICVGAISGAFGVQGEVRLKSFCAEPEAIANYGPLYSEDGKHSFTLRLTRTIPNGFSARMSGIATREQADAMKGMRLFADRARLPSLPDDEFYHADLIGMEVRDTGGILLGRVSAVHNHGATDLLEVSGPPPGGGPNRTVLLPFTQAIVPTVDLASRRIVADPPEGLFA